MWTVAVMVECMNQANFLSSRSHIGLDLASMTVTMASHPQVRGHFKEEPVSDAVSCAILMSHTYASCLITHTRHLEIFGEHNRLRNFLHTDLERDDELSQ